MLITLNARPLAPRCPVTASGVAVDARAADFTSRDQTGRSVPLSAHGVSKVTAAAGKSATLKVQGRFTSGAAQITWTHQKSVLTVWDFNIELD